MALGADRYASRADTLVFVGCVLLSGAAMSLPGRLRDPLAQALRQTVLAPFLSLQQQIQRLSASLARYAVGPVAAALVCALPPRVAGGKCPAAQPAGAGHTARHGLHPRRSAARVRAD